MSKINVLFVCMGNICRSPTAHGIFEDLVKQQGLADQIHVDSAGTHAYHIGESPDERSQATAKAHGYDLSKQRARKVERPDLDAFDYVLAMDKPNQYSLNKLASSQEQRERIHLFMDFAAERSESEVPDPYYGGEQGFEKVLKMVEVASQGLLDHIKSTRLSD
ncbi:low molecular weight phosphotyrosine protein phosphatase [Leucothrix sargassi]|nr:low molecular weight phosphotyrosine protein phosphatase [Leucothrix sargassi]